MADSSARFELPFLAAGQAQKEIFHNEALTIIDVLLHPVAQTAGDDAPPSSPALGECWIVGESPTGAWSGQADAIAAWTEGGWRFVAAMPGMLVWVLADEVWARWTGSAWLVQAAIGDPTGGATVDTEARAALSALLDAARAHGLIAT